MGNLLRDVRHGIRSLRTSLGLTLVVIAVLGIGIGANVGMFTVVDAAFLRPLRLPEPERLVQIQESPPSGGDMPVSYPNFVDWEKQSQSFESMGIVGAFQETLKRRSGLEDLLSQKVTELRKRAAELVEFARELEVARQRLRHAATSGADRALRLCDCLSVTLKSGSDACAANVWI